MGRGGSAAKWRKWSQLSLCRYNSGQSCLDVETLRREYARAALILSGDPHAVRQSFVGPSDCALLPKLSEDLPCQYNLFEPQDL